MTSGPLSQECKSHLALPCPPRAGNGAKQNQLLVWNHPQSLCPAPLIPLMMRGKLKDATSCLCFQPSPNPRAMPWDHRQQQALGACSQSCSFAIKVTHQPEPHRELGKNAVDTFLSSQLASCFPLPRSTRGAARCKAQATGVCRLECVKMQQGFPSHPAAKAPLSSSSAASLAAKPR